MKIVLASNNKHKIKEFKDILKGIEILSLNDIGFNDDIIEDGETFLENALIKAKTVSQYLKSIGYSFEEIKGYSLYMIVFIFFINKILSLKESIF